MFQYQSPNSFHFSFSPLVSICLFSMSLYFGFANKIMTTIFLDLASLVAQMVKNLSTLWEICVQTRGWEDPLEKEIATHSSILAWEIPWTE